MALTSKRPKLGVLGNEHKYSEDRISSLPSDIISCILSLLPTTKDAVATCVLSTTWKHRWRLITRLHFDDTLLLLISRSITDIDRTKLLSEFKFFVYRVLLLGRFECLEKFHLHCNHRYDPKNVNAWLTSALKYNLEEFDIQVPLIDSDLLPRSLFTCRTLVKLKLSGEVFMTILDSVSLPCVKAVDFSWVMFFDDDSITRFLSGCPVLDSLKMRTCVVRNVKVVKVSVPTLTSLSLSFLRHLEVLPSDDDVLSLHIVLETPLLSHISIKDNVAEGYVLKNLHNLTSARITTYGPLGRDTKSIVSFEDVHDVAVNDLLKGISKVKELFLSPECIDSRRYQLPTFENLTDLDFDAHYYVQLELLTKMLHRSPQLRLLRVTFDRENETVDLDTLSEEGGVPNCLVFHLKTIEIVNFGALRKEVEFVEYFLKNARILEKLIVRCRSSKEPLKVSELLTILPRASRACQLEVL